MAPPRASTPAGGRGPRAEARLSAGQSRRWRGALAVTSALLSVPACSRVPFAEPLRQHRCACAYVTDFDAPGRVEVRICARPADLDAVAASCAVSSGVGAVSACQCEATERSCVGEPPCALAVDAPR